MSDPRISVAVPLFNEEETLPELLRRVGSVLEGLPGGPHEMVLVDDGSSDGTRRLLEEAAERDGRVVSVSLSRNFGHQAALTAALDHATGDAVVLLDGDLQDPPRGDSPLPREAPRGLRRGLRQAGAEEGAPLAPLQLLGLLPDPGPHGGAAAAPGRR